MTLVTNHAQTETKTLAEAQEADALVEDWSARQEVQDYLLIKDLAESDLEEDAIKRQDKERNATLDEEFTAELVSLEKLDVLHRQTNSGMYSRLRQEAERRAETSIQEAAEAAEKAAATAPPGAV
ncbi:hypothetical protein EMWEY_00030500 [Eimeria maxima]|uniref:Uncharacterized protein n=1 Tax=Eimeria maxima TaxID=5804 RepID=U6M8A6_EIMMA|nr:hypothetical protein EMWEY_00030500 [Eimeria maxima]CDJ60442.1 hypothetical protein EMWEY_00030500 [Eimeria maxima]